MEQLQKNPIISKLLKNYLKQNGVKIMKCLNKNLKKAFTLMEIGMGLLILSILVIVCIPIVTNQIKKTDEYAYYLAFKTVEKMGSQIVAFGDPEGVAVNDANVGANLNVGNKLSLNSKLNDSLFNMFIPRANAKNEMSTLVTFPSYEYDYVRLCLGNTGVFKDYHGNASNTWQSDEIQKVQNEDLCKALIKNNYEMLKRRFLCPSSISGVSATAVITDLRSPTVFGNIPDRKQDLEKYCRYISQNCTNTTYSVVEIRQDKVYYECVIKVKDPDADAAKPLLDAVSDSTPTYALTCDRYGLSGMTNSSNSSVACECLSPRVRAANNLNVCCSAPTAGKVAYYVHSSSSCINCVKGAFNEKQGICCPEHSYYSSALGKCVCAEGYTPDSDSNLQKCNISGSTCPAGSHLVDDKCISNSPIIKAKRFCELVSYYWNASEHSCNTFLEDDGVAYYSSLFSAITANNTPYLSAKAVEGAFRNIEPNVVFANGLMMWILSDKSASIPGLSFNPDGFTPKLNTCKKLSDKNETTCTTSPEYFCKNDEHCFTIEAGDASNKLQDARSCCSSSNFSDLISKYEGKDYLRDSRTYAINGFTVFIDINGKKDNDELGGGGTLWKDVFPFYISSNGNVYPGYPLNAAKVCKDGVGDDEKCTEEQKSVTKDSSSLYQGGNSSYLSTDVFYYDIVDGKRTKITVYPSIPYARAMCLAGQISAYTPYCQNLGSKFRIIGDKSYSRIDQYVYSDDNPCYKHSCFLKLKNKIKYL